MVDMVSHFELLNIFRFIVLGPKHKVLVLVLLGENKRNTLRRKLIRLGQNSVCPQHCRVIVWLFLACLL